jgi:plastocyanin
MFRGERKTKMKPAFSLLPIFVILMVSTVVIACDGGAAASPEQENAGEALNAASETLVLEIKEGGVPTRIEPEALKVKKGSTLIFRFGGLDNEAHTCTANSLGIDLQVSGGEIKESPPVSIDETDTIFFFCRFHRGIGGAGSITVTELTKALL